MRCHSDREGTVAAVLSEMAVARSRRALTGVFQVRVNEPNDSLVYTPRECAIPKSVTIDGPNGTRTKTECARMPYAAVVASCLFICG